MKNFADDIRSLMRVNRALLIGDFNGKKTNCRMVLVIIQPVIFRTKCLQELIGVF